jgi:gelsolin
MAAKFEESNIALLGSKLNKELKFDSATSEKQWHGAGAKEGLQIWRIEKFEVKPWPKEQYGHFFSGDAYIVLHTYKPAGSKSDKLCHNLYFWLGKDSTQDEQGTAAYKTVELDDFLRGQPVQYREVQGYETDGFQNLFNALIYLDGGAAGGFNEVKPEEYKARLLHVKGKKHPRVTNVALNKSSLNGGDVFILDNGLNIYQWNGSKSHPDERTEANKIVRSLKDLRKSKPKTTILDGLEDSPEFWNLLGGKPSAEPAPIPDDQKAPEHKQAKLLRLTDRDPSKGLTLAKVAEGAAVKRGLLTSDDVYILDKGYQVFVYVGKNASKDEKARAIVYATRYLVDNKLPAHTTITRVIEGSDSPEFDRAW